MRGKKSLAVALGALGLAVLGSTELAAQEATAPVVCTAPVAPTGELAPWATPVAMTAAASDAATARARLPVGQAARLTLLQTPEVRYPRRPEKPGGSVSHGGLVRIDVAQAGTYRVALGSAAWVDLVRGGKAAVSINHGHGPDCTGIRKMVDYKLQRGRYSLQVAANGEPAVTVLVARLP
ncbi:MAG: hypothetical protein JSR28_01880 [Proteobacteria bacterium]|nr:hypothetical protein [Pseudomonadota bacterium]